MAGGTAAEHATGADTLAAMVLECAKRYDGTALKYKDGDDWAEMSYEELGENVTAVAAGLIALDIEPKDKVAIFSDTRPEWTLADLGTICAGAIAVPIYQTSSAEEAEHVLKDSEAKLVFVENDELLKTAKEAAQELDHVKQYVVFEGDAGDEDTITLDELKEKGEDRKDEVEQRAGDVSPDDVFTLIYTSGTTGPPKGCVLTHGNYRANCEMVEEVAEFEEGSVVFIFLPLAHALTRATQMVTLDVGATIAYWERDKDKALDNLQEVAPTHFPSVPRIFEKIHEQAMKKAGGGIKGKVFEKAIDVGKKVREKEQNGEDPGPILKKEYELADKQVLSNVRDLFGGNLVYALTGAAPVGKELLEFFHACGVLILEGYGATETSAVTAVNPPDDFKFGTVGKPLPGCELKIDDDTDDDGNGEILVKGPHIFQGYHGLEDKTKEVLTDDGWFKTGDLGSLDDDGYLQITGRAKEIIVTSSGKNITPTNIEEKLEDSQSVEQAVVYGDDRKYIVALIVPADGADEDDVQKAVDQANESLAKIEQVKKFKLLDRELSQDEGELTPTMKVKREQVFENFQEEIDALYDEDD
jgi:long-chain acyl-CoA synthetase